MSGANRAWADWEDRLMVVHYPDKGPDGVAPLLPRRSRIAIIQQAYRLGVRWKKHPTKRAWPAKEMKILAEWFPRGGYKAVQALLPHRTRDAIRVMARKRGIYRHGPRKIEVAANPIIQLPSRPLSFEEKLARVQSGQATVVPSFNRHHLTPTVRA